MGLTIACCIATFIVGFVLALVFKALSKDLKKCSADLSSWLGCRLIRLSMRLDNDYAAAWYCSVRESCVPDGLHSKVCQSVARTFMWRVFERPEASIILPPSEESRRKAAQKIEHTYQSYRTSNA